MPSIISIQYYLAIQLSHVTLYDSDLVAAFQAERPTTKPTDQVHHSAIMDAEFPQSDQEAEAHIHQIRCEKGLGGRPGEIAHNAADLEAALEL